MDPETGRFIQKAQPCAIRDSTPDVGTLKHRPLSVQTQPGRVFHRAYGHVRASGAHGNNFVTKKKESHVTLKWGGVF